MKNENSKNQSKNTATKNTATNVGFSRTDKITEHSSVQKKIMNELGYFLS
jgi:hypothetical protein